MRVTAGGRIVPNDLPSLSTPYWSQTSSNAGYQYPPSHPSHLSHHSHASAPFIPSLQNFSASTAGPNNVGGSNHPNSFVVVDPSNNLYQKVNGSYLPCNMVGGMPQFQIDPTTGVPLGLPPSAAELLGDQMKVCPDFADSS
jgi:hypothetical protein